MAIIVLGWGSLKSDTSRNEEHDLFIEGEWQVDGPILPIEFARRLKSNYDDKVKTRLTLVITPYGTPLPVFWAVLK